MTSKITSRRHLSEFSDFNHNFSYTFWPQDWQVDLQKIVGREQSLQLSLVYEGTKERVEEQGQRI